MLKAGVLHLCDKLRILQFQLNHKKYQCFRVRVESQFLFSQMLSKAQKLDAYYKYVLCALHDERLSDGQPCLKCFK